jgi:hypothetical protein
MSNPLNISSATPILGLPMLIAGQAQKEFFVNQALSILDSLHPRAVFASLPAPPAQPAEGACYRITGPAVQEWTGCEGHIAIRIAGDWHTISPREGMRLFDIAAGQSLFFRESWQSAGSVAAPTGGTVVDSEARAAIHQLLDTLRHVGILADAGN